MRRETKKNRKVENLQMSAWSKPEYQLLQLKTPWGLRLWLPFMAVSSGVRRRHVINICWKDKLQQNNSPFFYYLFKTSFLFIGMDLEKSWGLLSEEARPNQSVCTHAQAVWNQFCGCYSFARVILTKRYAHGIKWEKQMTKH